MYQDFFGFREPPFRITPDPRVLYRNRCYEEAIAALAYGIEQRKGFMSLVGEVGTGKTTLLRHLLETVSPNVRIVLLLYPTISFEEILEQVLLELGVPVGSSSKGAMLQRLHEFLHEHTLAGGNVALLFDEAQALDTRTLEELRLVSNFETGMEKIVQIVLAGQPEFEERLRQPEHRQLRQRIALHVRVRPLNASEVADYIRVRLEHVDARDPGLFEPDAMARIAELSAGIPRVVNVLCDACCTSAFALGRSRIDRAIVDETWSDYSGIAPDGGVSTAAPEPFLPPPPPLREPRAEGPARASVTEIKPPRVVVVPPPAPQRLSAEALAAAPTPLGPEDEILPDDEEPPDDEESPDGDEDLAPADGGDERWPVVAAFALGVVLAGVGMMQLLRRDDGGAEFARRSEPLAAAVTTAPSGESPAREPGSGLAPLPAAPPPATLPPVAAVPPAAAPPRFGQAPSAVDALDVVDEFRRAYEQRNVARLAELFAPSARKGDVLGRDAIMADYQRFFTGARDLLYSQPSAAVEPRGDHVIVRAPFQISYKDAANNTVESSGTAAWTIVRLDGATLIQSLDVHPTAPDESL